jgi:hypothetical protein
MLREYEERDCLAVEVKIREGSPHEQFVYVDASKDQTCVCIPSSHEVVRAPGDPKTQRGSVSKIPPRHITSAPKENKSGVLTCTIHLIYPDLDLLSVHVDDDSVQRRLFAKDGKGNYFLHTS